MSPRGDGGRPRGYTRSSHSVNVPSKYFNGTTSSRYLKHPQQTDQAGVFCASAAVNGPRNLPSLGRAKFPTLAGVVINR